MTKFNDTNKNLELLSEECAEVIQAKSKLVRFGLDHTHPFTRKKAITHFENEIGDLLAIIDILAANGTISKENLVKATADKIKRLEVWYDAKACDDPLEDKFMSDDH